MAIQTGGDSLRKVAPASPKKSKWSERRSAQAMALPHNRAPSLAEKRAASAVPGPADKADDPVNIRRALDDAVASSSGLWITFITFGAYLAVTVGSVTHRQLFLEEPIRLPLLNADLPLVAFFCIAPILLLIFHAYLLLNLKLLSDRVGRYLALYRGQTLPSDIDIDLRQQLPAFVFVQFLAGARRSGNDLVSFLSSAIAWITVVLSPILILLLAQIQFLAFHGVWVNWLLRALVIIDLLLVWLLWPRIDVAVTKTSKRVAAILSVMVFAFSVFFATFPGEYQDRNSLSNSNWLPLLERTDGRWSIALHSPYETLFSGTLSPVSGRPTSLWSNTLVIWKQQLFDPTILESRGNSTVTLRGRDLRDAFLKFADLRRADFTGADLRGAHLDGADLEDAEFGCAAPGSDVANRASACALLEGVHLANAHLPGAVLHSADLSQADLSFADLTGASLGSAQLEGVSLQFAKLQGAQLDLARLQGADLGSTKFQGAKLSQAQLQGADLRSASLQGTELIGADLSGANAGGANFQAANLTGAYFRAASLLGAQLQGATLFGTTFDAANLAETYVWRTDPEPTTNGSSFEGVLFSARAGDDLPTSEAVAKAPLGEIGLGREENVTLLITIATEGVTDADVSKAIADKLRALRREGGNSPKDNAINAAWGNLFRNQIEPDEYKQRLSKELLEMLCAEEANSFVVKGIVRSRLNLARSEPLLDAPAIAAKLTGPQENCPGAEILDDDQRAELQKKLSPG